MSDLQLTISSDDEESNVGTKIKRHESKRVDESDDDNDDMNDEFEFGGLMGEDGGSTFLANLDTTDNTWSYKAALKVLEENDSMNGRKPARTNVASIIAAARQNLKNSISSVPQDEDMKGEVTASENESEDDASQSDSEDESSDDDEVDDYEEAKTMQGDTLVDRNSLKKTKATTEGDDNSDMDRNNEDDEGSISESEDEEAKREATKAAKYFDTTEKSSTQDVEVFAQLNLSRPLLRGVASIGFVTPTPIQSRVIPVALAGRDVCASAQTGSGKTAAFLLPIMERILQRGGGRVQMKSSSGHARGASLAAIKGLILTPTRELAAQCLGMMTAMAKFTGLRAVLIVGGAKNVKAQAAELRTRPDVVVGTPGRLLDHLTNSAGVDLDDLEFLILDEADRLLDLGFQDEVHEIVKSCPIERQTLLFSATMGTKVDELIRLSLKRPVRIHVSGRHGDNTEGGVEVANRLEQEFVRVRTGNEGIKREAMLLSVLTRTYKSRVIVFFDTKVDAHRLMIVAGLCGIKCAELHGNLTQVQRLQALEQFREGSVDVLFATDLAARGLDISSVEAVINFEMPAQVETYVHRIGRTARAGRGGKSCTLIGEGRRHLMKDVIRDAEQKRRMVNAANKRDQSTSSSTGAIRSRTVPSTVVSHFTAKILSLKPHVNEVLAAEAVARMDRIAEMEAMKAQNIIQHWDEIKSRPQKEWFASSKEKLSTKEAVANKQQLIEEKVGTGMHRMSRKKRRLREAKEDCLEMEREAREAMEETGEKSKLVMTQNAMKSTAKSFKRQLVDEENAREARSINEEPMSKAAKKRRAIEKASKKKKKGAFASDSLGDSGLFDEEKITHSEKSTDADKPAKSNYAFKGYDPNGPVRKHKAKGHHKFKSKSKHKRR